MAMNFLKNTTSQGDRQSPRAAYESIVQTLSNALDSVRFKRKSAKKAKLRITALQADRAEGRLPDVAPDLRRMKVDEERALYGAWAEGFLDAVEIEIEERGLAIRKMRELLPAAKSAEADAEAKVRAAQAEAEKVRVSGDLAHRIGNEEQKLRELEKERAGYQRVAERIAAGERPVFWQPPSGNLPPREEPVVFTYRDFPADGVHNMVQREKAAAELTQRYQEKQEREWRERCRRDRLGFTIEELRLHEEDSSPKEVA